MCKGGCTSIISVAFGFHPLAPPRKRFSTKIRYRLRNSGRRLGTGQRIRNLAARARFCRRTWCVRCRVIGKKLPPGRFPNQGLEQAQRSAYLADGVHRADLVQDRLTLVRGTGFEHPARRREGRSLQDLGVSILRPRRRCGRVRRRGIDCCSCSFIYQLIKSCLIQSLM